MCLVGALNKRDRKTKSKTKKQNKSPGQRRPSRPMHIVYKILDIIRVTRKNSFVTCYTNTVGRGTTSGQEANLLAFSSYFLLLRSRT